MMPYVIGLIVAAAGAGAALVLVSGGVSMFWRSHAHRLLAAAPAARARTLAALRLLPAVSAIIAGTVVLIAFVRLEPADAGEVLGFALPVAALATVVAFGWRVGCACRAWIRMARTIASWSSQPAFAHADHVGELRRGRPAGVVDSEFPVVAVVGVWQPRLYVARSVVEFCDREELNAIIAHESAHVSAHDNLTRVGFLCAPFALPATARALERAWIRASEEAADDIARRDNECALALASALTKVARLATGQRMPLLHVSAIFSGSGVEERVRRLLATDPPHATDSTAWQYTIPVALAAVACGSAAGLRQIYNLAEYCVRYLP